MGVGWSTAKSLWPPICNMTRGRKLVHRSSAARETRRNGRVPVRLALEVTPVGGLPGYQMGAPPGVLKSSPGGLGPSWGAKAIIDTVSAVFRHEQVGGTIMIPGNATVTAAVGTECCC